MSEIELLKRKLDREIAARKQAERILEAKALELYSANESLRKLNESLEEQIQVRTMNLQESETKYRNVVENASDIIYSTDEEGYFTFVNPKGTDAFGFTLKEIIGKRYIDFVLDEYKEQLFEYYTQFRDKAKVTDYFEFPIRSKDNKVHWIGQNVNRVESTDGSFYYNAVARDITLRKNTELKLARAQTALTQSEVKYRSVLENLKLGLMEVDTKGKIIRVYDHFCKMTGYSKEELIGKDAIKALLAEGFEDVINWQDKAQINQQSGVHEVQIKRKDGKHIWVLISGAPFYNSYGEIIGSLGVHYDITDRKDLETNLEIARHKAVKAQKAEQQFLAHMSHEIRTPLNAIIGMSHLLTDTPLDAKQKEFVEILSDSANLLKGLVSDILDISKIDSGMIEKNESTFDLSNMAKRLNNTFALRAQDKGIDFLSKIESKGSCIVKSDLQWLNQILNNLISNAIKFTQEGQVKFNINETKNDTSYSTFHFEVSDTGIGMSSNEVELIFNSFKQANKNIRTEFGGTGLGLSIASRLVALLGGVLKVQSKEGEGSKFFFSLDMETTNKLPTSSSPLESFGTNKNNNIKILVVEDNLMNQKYISTLLHKWNLEFDIAENGQIGVDKFKAHTYDLIFMDLSMPVMDGYEATNIIRSLSGETMPIIALTASTFLSKKELALQSGMTDFLAKPFTPKELSKMLHKHLNKGQEIITDKEEYQKVKTLDHDELKKLYNGDDSYALEIFKTYKMVIESEIETLKSALDSGEKDPIRKQVHKIKPMFKMVGINEVYEICDLLETKIEDINGKEILDYGNNIISKVFMYQDLIDSEIQRLQKNLKQQS